MRQSQTAIHFVGRFTQFPPNALGHRQKRGQELAIVRGGRRRNVEFFTIACNSAELDRVGGALAGDYVGHQHDGVTLRLSEAERVWEREIPAARVIQHQQGLLFRRYVEEPGLRKTGAKRCAQGAVRRPILRLDIGGDEPHTGPLEKRAREQSAERRDGSHYKTGRL